MNRIKRNLLVVCLFGSCVLLFGLSQVHADQLKTVEQQKASLFEELANASSELEGRHIEDAIWRLWFDQSPTPKIRSWLDAGIERREAYDYEAAETHFDQVIDAAPAYAEGYNQRAFIRFLRDNIPQAQIDLEKTLALEPSHFGAMAGMFLVLFRQNSQDAAFRMLQKAVLVHPWLKERSSLPEAWWPTEYRLIHEPGQDI